MYRSVYEGNREQGLINGLLEGSDFKEPQVDLSSSGQKLYETADLIAFAGLSLVASFGLAFCLNRSPSLESSFASLGLTYFVGYCISAMTWVHFLPKNKMLAIILPMCSLTALTAGVIAAI